MDGFPAWCGHKNTNQLKVPLPTKTFSERVAQLGLNHQAKRCVLLYGTPEIRIC